MTPIKPGHAQRLGLRKPEPVPVMRIVPGPMVSATKWAEFVQHMNEAHNQAVVDISGVVYRAARSLRRNRL